MWSLHSSPFPVQPHRHLEVPPPEFEYQPRFNIAPTQLVPVVAAMNGTTKWTPTLGFDTFLGQGSGDREWMINARSETVAEKPSFRSAFRKRRCIIPADGFFEWKKEGGEEGRGATKTPFWIHLSTREPFAIRGPLGDAGLLPRERILFTFTILTTEASESIHDIHPRMPVILSPFRQGHDGWTRRPLQKLSSGYSNLTLRGILKVTRSRPS